MSESLFWVPILAADGPYWVPIPGKVGSLFLSMEVLISFGNSAVGRILPQCVFLHAIETTELDKNRQL